MQTLTFQQIVLDIYRVQSFVKHPAHWTASRSLTLQLLSIELSLRNPCNKIGENRLQPAGETHKPDPLPLSPLTSLIETLKYATNFVTQITNYKLNSRAISQ